MAKPFANDRNNGLLGKVHQMLEEQGQGKVATAPQAPQRSGSGWTPSPRPGTVGGVGNVAAAAPTAAAGQKNFRDITESSFQTEVLSSPLPVMVDVWAKWCNPCKVLMPHIERLAGEYAGRVRVVKLDMDQSPNMRSKLAIQGVPTLIMFVNGQEVDRLVGAHPVPRIKQMLDKHALANAVADTQQPLHGHHHHGQQQASDQTINLDRFVQRRRR